MTKIKTISINLPIKNFFALCIGFLLFNLNSFGQTDSANDTLKLPFPIAKEKRLSDEDLKEKKEGIYLTGEPDLSSDPLTGFGFGAEAQLFFDGKKTDPFFAYTPYRAELDLEVFYTTKGYKELELICDIPYIFDTKWRFRGHCEYALDPDYAYFGVTENSLKPLSYYPNNDSSKAIVNNASYDNYTNNLVGSVADYNTFQQLEKLLNMTMERSWFEGRLRTLIGFEVSGYVTNTPLNSNSLLHQQYQEGLITGYGANTTTLLQLGIMYDTRDNEPDPTSGIFAELTNEYSATFLGSEFNYNRVFIHYNLYHRLFQKLFKKMVFAARIGAGYTSGNAPFYEYMDDWSSEGDVNGLGGPQTLRGYAQSRFAAPVNSFANFELRYHFLKTDFLEQHLEFAAVPFFDLGGVWNTIDRITNTQNIRYSEGLGLQVAWNEDTILRFDYGISAEGNQFYFGIRKTF